MPNSVRGFLQPYLHLWHLLISWRLQVLSSRRLRRLLHTIADYNAIFDSDFSSVFCLYYGFELCTWNYGTCGTADEYVFNRYAAEDSGWICCFVSDRVPVAECGKLYF